MDFSLSEGEKQLKREVHDFLQMETTIHVAEELASGLGPGTHSRQLLRKMGDKHWLTITWPEQYGGMGGTNVQDLIIRELMEYFGWPIQTPFGAVMAGPTILMYGNEEQKSEYLPKIARGEIDFALGYTEPEAGSDLAGLNIKAIECGNVYIVNGQKTFSSYSHCVEYHWLAARTDPNAARRHHGISLFIVDLSTPGISIKPLWTMGGMRTNNVFYDDVQIPKENLIGEKNRGWYYITTALDLERMFTLGNHQRYFEQLLQCARNNFRNNDLLRHRLSELKVEIEIGRLLGYKIAWMRDQGIIPTYEPSMLKLYTTELLQRLANTGMQLLGFRSQLKQSSKWALLDGMIERLYLDSPRVTIAGGTSEIQRNVIAVRGLGLPRG